MRAIITHFDGDPFTLNFWLMLYDKYWRGEVDRIYMTVTHDEVHVHSAIVAYNKKRLAAYPEIHVTYIDHHIYPEQANQLSYKNVTEEQVGFIESDGFVFGKGVVDQCFRLLDQGQDIVAPKWELISDPYVKATFGHQGFMRCFFFSKKSLLDKTDMDFMPRHMNASETMPNTSLRTSYAMDLDCFGWMSLQLAFLEPKITFVPANVVHPASVLDPNRYWNFPWLHVRQMSSSALGLGGDEYYLWKDNAPELQKRIMRLFNGDFPNGPAEFTYIKAIAFKLLICDMIGEVPELRDVTKSYLMVLHAVMAVYALPKDRIYEIKGFYRGLFRL